MHHNGYVRVSEVSNMDLVTLLGNAACVSHDIARRWWVWASKEGHRNYDDDTLLSKVVGDCAEDVAMYRAGFESRCMECGEAMAPEYWPRRENVLRAHPDALHLCVECGRSADALIQERWHTAGDYLCHAAREETAR